MSANHVAIPLELSDGKVIAALITQSDQEEDVALKGFKMSDVTSTITTLAKDIMKPLTNLECDKVNVEFGLSLTLKEGKLVSMLASASGTASVKVNLEFK